MNDSWANDLSTLNIKISNMSSSMVSNWPDAIMCDVHNGEFTIFYLTHAPYSDNLFYYRWTHSEKIYNIRFNADGTYNSDVNVGISVSVWSF